MFINLNINDSQVLMHGLNEELRIIHNMIL